MREIILVFIFMLTAVNTAASGCDTTVDAPAEAVVKERGVLNSGSVAPSSFETTVAGGQVVYVQVENANVLGAGIVVKIDSAGKELCSSALVILPKSSQTFSTGVFSDRTVTYDVSVSAAEGSEVFANITVLTLPVS